MIYIDCTSTNSINALTGIQRVVFRILKELSSDSLYADNIAAVALSSDGFVKIDALRPHSYTNTQYTAQKSALFFENAKRLLRRYQPLYKVAKRIYHFLWRNNTKLKSKPPVVFKNGDTLLFLDACWDMPIWDEVKRAKASGAKIVFVIYDLIPLLYPQFCESSHIDEFKTFIDKTFAYADKYIGISKTVRDDVMCYMFKKDFYEASTKLYDYFYLGADFTNTNYSKGNIRAEIKSFFDSKAPVYLTVSTIEPRKNHAFILDAFDKLWQEGADVKLLFIGKVGWKVDKLISRIHSHPKFSSSLLAIHNASDAELSYSYTNAKALIFASFVEGFGLPIIEAMNHLLPVFVSDTKIHREIGGENVEYFSLEDCGALAQIISDDMTKQKKQIAHTEWLSWAQSAKMLISKVQE